MHFSQEQRTLESTYETPVTNYLKVNTSDPESVDTRCTGRNRSSSPASISERFAALHSQQPASSGSVALMGAKGKTSKWALSICVGSCDRSVLSSLTTLLLVQRIVFDIGNPSVSIANFVYNQDGSVVQTWQGDGQTSYTYLFDQNENITTIISTMNIPYNVTNTESHYTYDNCNPSNQSGLFSIKL